MDPQPISDGRISKLLLMIQADTSQPSGFSPLIINLDNVKRIEGRNEVVTAEGKRSDFKVFYTDSEVQEFNGQIIGALPYSPELLPPYSPPST